MVRVPETPGIYFCFDENNIPLYVGRSTNLVKRFYNSILPIICDNTTQRYLCGYIEIRETVCDIVEKLMIVKYKPKHNQNLSTKKVIEICKLFEYFPAWLSENEIYGQPDIDDVKSEYKKLNKTIECE